jgi:hypothetical protein
MEYFDANKARKMSSDISNQIFSKVLNNIYKNINHACSIGRFKCVYHCTQEFFEVKDRVINQLELLGYKYKYTPNACQTDDSTLEINW